MGYCDEALELEEKRVFIDIRKVPKKVFKITRGDDVLYNAGNMGMLLSFIADKTELNKDKDNQELGICDYIDSSPTPPSEPTIPDETEDLSAKITFKGSQELIIGGRSQALTGSFVDNDGDTTSDKSINTRFPSNVILSSSFGIVIR